MPLTEKQQAFADTKLRTIMSNTGIKGITYEAFPSGSFIVRDLDGSFIDSFGDLTEAVECLLCCGYSFRSVEPAVVDDLIDYLGATKFLH
jgi:hypothetical protein